MIREREPRALLLDHLAHVDALLGESEQLCARGDALGEPLDVRHGSGRACALSASSARSRAARDPQTARLPRAQGGWPVLGREFDRYHLDARIRAAATATLRRAASARADSRSRACASRSARGLGGIELDQHVASLDAAAVFNRDTDATLTGLQRLHHLGAAARLDRPWATA